MQVAFEDVRVNNGFICTQRRTLSGFGVHSSSGATVRVAGKVGELAQGVDEEGAFLVSGAIGRVPMQVEPRSCWGKRCGSTRSTASTASTRRRPAGSSSRLRPRSGKG